MKGVISGVFVCGLLAGCATPPKHYSVETSRTYNASYEQVWSRLIVFLAQRNIPLKAIAKDSGVIYAEALRFDEGQADCGGAGMLKPITRLARFNVLVQPADGQQLVSVNINFTETRYNSFDHSSHSVECRSKGVVEKEILNAIGIATTTPSSPTGSTPHIPASNSSFTPGSSGQITKEQQINELMNTPGISYEEYQRRYRLIMGQ